MSLLVLLSWPFAEQGLTPPPSFSTPFSGRVTGIQDPSGSDRTTRCGPLVESNVDIE